MIEIILTVMISASLFVAAVLCLIKFFCENTKWANRLPFCNGVTEINDSLENRKIPYLKIILFGLGVRFLIYVAGTLIVTIFLSEDSFAWNDFVSIWHRWDSTGYIHLAKEGYGYLENGEHILLVFFPLYSIFVKSISVFTGEYYFSALAVSYAFYLGSLIYIYKLALLDISESIAQKTVVLISIFPFSFFFGSIHTESVTLFMMTATLYYTRKHNWLLVMIFGMLSGLSRMVGSLVVVPALMEYIRYEKPFQTIKEKQYLRFWKDIFTKFIYIPLIGIGGSIYLTINYFVDRSPTAFLKHQEGVWDNTPQFIFKTIYDLLHRMFENFDTIAGCIWLPELLLVILSIVLLFLTWKRLPSMYSIFFISYLLLSYSASWLLSGGRYMSIALPLFFMIALWTDKKESRYLWTVMVFIFLLGIYLAAFLTNKQVM